jgi:hypothetical protein
LAVGVVAQLVPFQDSANVVVLWRESVEPTASHADAKPHATPASVREKKAHSVPHTADRGPGCWSIAQLAPFQRSISGWPLIGFTNGDCHPTATQLFTDVQNTPRSSISPANGGVGCADHREPFQASMSAPRPSLFGTPARV